MTVVPDARRMMSEMIRVCKPGGRIVVISATSPALIRCSNASSAAPSIRLPKRLGWTTRLRANHVLDDQPITVERNERISRISLHRVVIATKLAA